MSKINIPTCTLSDSECDTLFQSIAEKLNIQNPRFHYPIYNKIVDNASNLRGLIFDSKFKVREILSKVLDTDSEDYETDDEASDCNPEDKPIYTFNIEDPQQKETNTNNDIDNLDDVLNTDQDVELVKSVKIEKLNASESAENASEGAEDDEDDENNEDDDREIDNAINNIFTATALVERENKTTGDKSVKEEQIHIKKSPLLEPIKILKDEFLIPARLKNQSLVDETLQRTRAKLDSYNNSAHVEALFLYLGNKLVESGKCPSFPYYYGCINGEDPNYHHDITDEYEMVSRTKWFRHRVKTDFDLLILEGDEMDDKQNEIIEQMYHPRSHHKFQDDENVDINSQSDTISSVDENADADADEDADADKDASNTDTDFKAYKKYLSKSLGINFDDDADREDAENGDPEEEDDDIEQALEFLDKNGGGSDDSNEQLEDVSKKTNNIIPIDNIDSTLNNILTEMEDKTNTNATDDFIKDIDDMDLDIQLEDADTESHTESHTEDSEPVAISEDHLDDDLIEVLSDVDKDGLTFDEFEDNSMNNQYYLKCAQIPVNLCMMEKLDQTLDNLLDDGYNMSETEWFSMFFQVAFGLAIAQKYFNFVHNDLHSSNVMFKATELRNLYFQIGNVFYRIPTYGKITKIIDFARGTFKLGDRWIFSDQFKEDGDAWGQYDYPQDGTLANCEHKPNPSFDLVRLGTTVIQRLDDVSHVREFVESITRDDYDNSLCYEEDTFQLYIDIAHNAHNAIPIEVLERPEFERFRVARDRVPKGVYVFKY
jgi:hypothetical protein